MNRAVRRLALALLLALAFVRSAEAHATLVRSEPAAGALLQAAPSELVLEFSEELDPSFSHVQLFDSKQQIVNAGPGQIDRTAPKRLRLALSALPKDSYTAIWRVRSAADGHVTEGSVPFGVGVAPTTSLIPPPGAPDPATEPPAPLDAATRWLELLLAALAFGGLPFGLLVWRPALRIARAAGADLAVADATMTGAIRRLIIAGGALFLLANLAFLVVQAADASGTPLAQALGAPLIQLIQGRSGGLVVARMALTLLIGLIVWRLPPVERGAGWRWWLALALVGALLLTFSLGAHAAAVEQGTALAIALDWLHIAAMVVWLGGLAPLAIAIRAGRRAPDQALPLAALIPRFSRLALACVALLTLSGIYSYILHINSFDLLAATTYGRALLIKLGLFVVLLLAGALNLLVLSPRLRVAGARLAGHFGRSVRVELIAGALLLLAVGVMTSVAPSTTAWEAHERQGLAQQATEGDVTLTLRVAPAQIGDNEFAVDVADSRPGAAAAPSKVLLRFDMVGMAMGELQTDTQQTTPQRYTARGSFTSMGRRWQVEVVLRRAGFDDVRHTFELDIVRSAAAR